MHESLVVDRCVHRDLIEAISSAIIIPPLEPSPSFAVGQSPLDHIGSLAFLNDIFAPHVFNRFFFFSCNDATEHNLGNVAFLRTRIEFIESLFAENEISEIWITFADPQIGREKKRLTAPLFMNRYRNFLCKGGIIHLKTDSRYLHEYSLAMAQQNDLHILAAATDIYGADRERLYDSELSSICGRAAVDALFEVQTFYESQYLAQGFPITYLSFLADHEGDYLSPEWAEDLWKDEGHHFVIPSGLAVASKFYPEGQ